MNDNQHEAPKPFRRIAVVMISAVSLILAASALAKLAHVAKVVAPLNAFGFDDHKVILIAIGEMSSAMFFLIPRTRVVGLLLVSFYFGGAIATHLQHGESIVAPAVLLIVAWVASTLENPALLREN